MSGTKETIQAGTFKEFFEEGDFFRLLATTGPVRVEFYYQGRETVDLEDIEAGYAEYFRDQQISRFDRVRIYSTTTQQVQFVTRYGSDVRYDRGASSVTGTVALDDATLSKIKPRAAEKAYANQTSAAVNTAVQIFAPASNPNGTEVYGAFLQGYSIVSGLKQDAFIHHTAAPTTSAPASEAAGTVILANAIAASGTADQYAQNSLNQMVFIPPGHGLYYHSGPIAWLHSSRSVRWKHL